MLDMDVKIKNVDSTIRIMDTILVVWLGVMATKYENITNIPPM